MLLCFFVLANSLNLKYPRGSSGITQKNSANNAHSTIKKSDSPLLILKSKEDSVDEGIHVMNGVSYTQSGSESSDGSIVVPKSGPNSVDKNYCSKNSSISIQSSGETSKSSSSMKQKGKYKNADASIQSSGKTSECSSSLMPKGKHISLDDNSLSSFIVSEPHRLTSNLKMISLSDKSQDVTSDNAIKAKSHKQYEPDKWMLPDKAEDKLTQLNLAIVSQTFFLVI